jgi:hypothetical protein
MDSATRPRRRGLALWLLGLAVYVLLLIVAPPQTHHFKDTMVWGYQTFYGLVLAAPLVFVLRLVIGFLAGHSLGLLWSPRPGGKTAAVLVGALLLSWLLGSLLTPEKFVWRPAEGLLALAIGAVVAMLLWRSPRVSKYLAWSGLLVLAWFAVILPLSAGLGAMLGELNAEYGSWLAGCVLLGVLGYAAVRSLRAPGWVAFFLALPLVGLQIVTLAGVMGAVPSTVFFFFGLGPLAAGAGGMWASAPTGAETGRRESATRSA